MIMILAPPAGDAFNFVVNLSVYPSQAFLLALAVGLYFVRYERKKAGLPRADFRASLIFIVWLCLGTPHLAVLMRGSLAFGMQLMLLLGLECEFPFPPSKIYLELY
jgi:hypothetical protein